MVSIKVTYHKTLHQSIKSKISTRKPKVTRKLSAGSVDHNRIWAPSRSYKPFKMYVSSYIEGHPIPLPDLVAEILLWLLRSKYWAKIFRHKSVNGGRT